MTTLQVSRSHRAKRPPIAKPKETKQQREKRLKSQHAATQQLRERLVDDPDSVLTYKEWCALSGHSERQGRRIIASGKGPKVTQLSDRRIGVSRKHHREWLEKRAR